MKRCTTCGTQDNRFDMVSDPPEQWVHDWQPGDRYQVRAHEYSGGRVRVWRSYDYGKTWTEQRRQT